jgi:hypothetical protein
MIRADEAAYAGRRHRSTGRGKNRSPGKRGGAEAGQHHRPTPAKLVRLSSRSLRDGDIGPACSVCTASVSMRNLTRVIPRARFRELGNGPLVGDLSRSEVHKAADDGPEHFRSAVRLNGASIAPSNRECRDGESQGAGWTRKLLRTCRHLCRSQERPGRCGPAFPGMIVNARGRLTLTETWNDLLAHELQRAHDLFVRNKAAAIDLRKDAV